MSDFSRRLEPVTLFEGLSDHPIELTLRINDDFGERFNRNEDNEIGFEQIQRMLQGGNKICFFQRQKEFDRQDKKTGKTVKQSQHKIIIPTSNERAIEGLLDLFLYDEYSYRVIKLKEINFFNPPVKNTIQKNCKIIFRQFNDYRGFISQEAFKELYSAVEQLPLPVIDINKEKDRKIWHNYVLALKRLVKQKEHIWKIQNVSTPYVVSEDGKERAAYIDISINEKDLVKQLESDLKNAFNADELEDYGVSTEKAFIEFKNFRELSQEELTKVNELGQKFFYEVSSLSPMHYLSGAIVFKYSDDSSRLKVFETIESRLIEDYQLEAEITENGIINLPESEIPHVEKIIKDYFGNILSIEQNKTIQLRVAFHNQQELSGTVRKVKEKLDTEGFTRSTVMLSQDKENITVEVSTFIPPTKFLDEGLTLQESITRFAPDRITQLKPIEGLEIVNNHYQLINPTKGEVEDANTKISQQYPGVRIWRRPTIYVFGINKGADLNTLRSFKTETDVKNKTEFNIKTSVLTVTANDEFDYKAQIERIKKAFANISIEEKPFKVVYLLQFKNDIVNKRDSLITKIKSEIRQAVTSKVDFDAIKNNTKLLFYYRFNSENERELFKHAVQRACTSYVDLLDVNFDNDLGRSVYELIKDETLELENEREIANNVRQATFIYITPEQHQQLSKAIERFGDEARFREGIQIGTLIKKDRGRLKFRINERFDELLNGRDSDRIDIEEIAKGYIKPIFPGELTNIDRMIRAMDKVTRPDSRVGYPVNRNLSNFLFDPNEARQSAADIEEEKQHIIVNLNEPLLKDQPKQLEAVTKSLLAKDLALIQGPPGTGKTTVIAEIIWQTLLLAPESKILITSQTNLAVDNALERLSGKKLVRPIRIGNIEKFEDEGKAYSNDKIKIWLNAKSGSPEEHNNKDNAISKWIETVKAKCSSDEKYESAITKWKAGLERNDQLIKRVFTNAYYRHVNIFAATCSECGSRNFSDAFRNVFHKNSDAEADVEFDVVIMDEASKATPPELVLPLTLGKKVIIIGDHKQLPPMLDEQEFSEALEAVGATKLIESWTSEDYKISQFEKLFKNAPKSIVASLDTQFRMHEQIMNCISQFYTDQEELENGLLCGIKSQMNIPDFNVKASRWHGLKLEPFIDVNHHAIWVNVEAPETKVGTSYENDGEIQAVKTVLKAITLSNGYQDYCKHFTKEEEKEIGVITYYMPQMMRIRNGLYPHFTKEQWRSFEQNKYENEFQTPFRINTVDRFQGMERNIIIISTVRSHKQYKTNDSGKKILVDNNKYPKALGFAKELQRINVGFSRAKRLLIVVGNEAHFLHKPEYAEAIKRMHRIDIKQLENLLTA